MNLSCVKVAPTPKSRITGASCCRAFTHADNNAGYNYITKYERGEFLRLSTSNSNPFKLRLCSRRLNVPADGPSTTGGSPRTTVRKDSEMPDSAAKPPTTRPILETAPAPAKIGHWSSPPANRFWTIVSNAGTLYARSAQGMLWYDNLRASWL